MPNMVTKLEANVFNLLIEQLLKDKFEVRGSKLAFFKQVYYNSFYMYK